jgi:hypothetical protein
MAVDLNPLTRPTRRGQACLGAQGALRALLLAAREAEHQSQRNRCDYDHHRHRVPFSPTHVHLLSYFIFYMDISTGFVGKPDL